MVISSKNINDVKPFKEEKKRNKKKRKLLKLTKTLKVWITQNNANTSIQVTIMTNCDLVINLNVTHSNTFKFFIFHSGHGFCQGISNIAF